jgi:small subunit ribosomal protein S16
LVKIRLKRMGTTKRPVYRLVVADSRSPRDGRFIESIGFYDPLPNPAVVSIDAERVQLWLRRGARPSDSARQLLVKEGILAARPFKITPRAAPAEPAPAEPAAATATAAVAPATEVAAETPAADDATAAAADEPDTVEDATATAEDATPAAVDEPATTAPPAEAVAADEPANDEPSAEEDPTAPHEAGGVAQEEPAE